jgi:hypothetical protein
MPTKHRLITLRNSHHNTAVTFRVPELPYVLTQAQVRRAKRCLCIGELCRTKSEDYACIRAGDLGQLGPQEVQVVQVHGGERTHYRLDELRPTTREPIPKGPGREIGTFEYVEAIRAIGEAGAMFGNIELDDIAHAVRAALGEKAGEEYRLEAEIIEDRGRQGGRLEVDSQLIETFLPFLMLYQSLFGSAGAEEKQEALEAGKEDNGREEARPTAETVADLGQGGPGNTTARDQACD